MAEPFFWPTDLRHPRNKKPSLIRHQPRPVLVTRRADPKTGKRKTASSSDGLIDIAAAVYLGQIPSKGLPGLLLELQKDRVIRLLRKNTVKLVKPKRATVDGNHATRVASRLAQDALPVAIGPAYLEAHKQVGLKESLKTKTVIRWIKTNLEDPTSRLCCSLAGTKYQDLIGLKRNNRWWRNLLNLRQKGQSNLTG